MIMTVEPPLNLLTVCYYEKLVNLLPFKDNSYTGTCIQNGLIVNSLGKSLKAKFLMKFVNEDSTLSVQRKGILVRRCLNFENLTSS